MLAPQVYEPKCSFYPRPRKQSTLRSLPDRPKVSERSTGSRCHTVLESEGFGLNSRHCSASVGLSKTEFLFALVSPFVNGDKPPPLLASSQGWYLSVPTRLALRSLPEPNSQTDDSPTSRMPWTPSVDVGISQQTDRIPTSLQRF